MKIKTSAFQSAQHASKSLPDFIREEDFTVQLVAVPQILFQGTTNNTKTFHVSFKLFTFSFLIFTILSIFIL